MKNCQQAAKTLELSGCVVAEREQANKRHRSSREDRTDKTQRKEEERHKKSGEQAAKNISAHVQQRTCVVGEGGSSRKAKIPDNVLAASMDVCMFWEFLAIMTECGEELLM